MTLHQRVLRAHLDAATPYRRPIWRRRLGDFLGGVAAGVALAFVLLWALSP